METSATARGPWRLWTGIALVLVALALAQACGQSGSRTGPTSDAKLELKLRRVGGAELQAGCTGTYSVSGPGVNIQNAPLPADGQISFQGQIGQTYTVSVQITCKSGCIQSGSVTFTLQQGPNKAEIVLTCSKVLGLACQSPVAPNQVSHCTCSVQSAGSANIAWQGATPTGGNTAEFSSPNPGSYPVTCTINGVDSLTTNVVVTGNTGKVTVNNTLSEDSLDVSFNNGLGSLNNIPPLGTKVKNDAPTGNYTATAFWCGECSCSVSFTLDIDENEVLNLPSDCD